MPAGALASNRDPTSKALDSSLAPGRPFLATAGDETPSLLVLVVRNEALETQKQCPRGPVSNAFVTLTLGHLGQRRRPA